MRKKETSNERQQRYTRETREEAEKYRWRWTREDTDELIYNYQKGMPQTLIAAKLGRTWAAVKSKINEIYVKKKNKRRA